jgi:hypothetical protein
MMRGIVSGMSATVAFRVMAHPKRKAWAEAIAAESGSVIVWDEVGHAWDTGQRALLSGVKSGAPHVCGLQADTILSEGLRESDEALVQSSAEHPVGLYAGDSPRTRAAMEHDPRPWWAGTGPIWGPGIVVPTGDVGAIIEFGDRMRMTSYDTRLWHYYRRHRIWCYYPYPSMVQHRTGHGSLISRGRDREAPSFGTGLGRDWSTPPLILDNNALHPRVTMWKENRRKVVRRDTRTWRMAVAQGWVEQ